MLLCHRTIIIALSRHRNFSANVIALSHRHFIDSNLDDAIVLKLRGPVRIPYYSDYFTVLDKIGFNLGSICLYIFEWNQTMMICFCCSCSRQSMLSLIKILSFMPVIKNILNNTETHGMS